MKKRNITTSGSSLPEEGGQDICERIQTDANVCERMRICNNVILRKFLVVANQKSKKPW